MRKERFGGRSGRLRRVDFRLRAFELGAVQNDLRAVLQYVPKFQGRVFVVSLVVGRMPEGALAEVLLDLRALQQVGVDLVIYARGEGSQVLEEWLVERELPWERSEAQAEEVRKILKRGQVALVDGREAEPLGDEVVQLAQKLGAQKLITFLAEGLAPAEHPLHAISRAEASKQGGILAKAAEVCGYGIPRVHLLDETRQGVLMAELFSNEGVGVMVHDDAYRLIRPLREEDLPELLAMIGRSVRRSHLIPRDYDEIRMDLDDFLVLTVDENVVGCVALHPNETGRMGELACLYVKQSHERLGYGSELVRAVERKAQTEGLETVFCLTTRASQYFTKHGYVDFPAELIPEARFEKLAKSGRDSVVLAKSMTTKKD